MSQLVLIFNILSRKNNSYSTILIFQYLGEVKRDEKNTCRKLLKSYKIEDEELIEPAEDDDVLTTHMGMVDLLKNNLKRKINNTKDKDLYIDCRFIFGSADRAERLFSYCKYIKRETRNRLTLQLFEAITF